MNDHLEYSMLKITYVIILLILFLSTGCATTRNFELLPQAPEDFELEYEDLSSKFAEVPVYETIFRGIPPNTPYLEDLIDVWGPADYEKTNWFEVGVGVGGLAGLYILTTNVVVTGLTAGIILLTPPSKTYVWHKGIYCIEVNVVSMLHNSYKKTIQYWKWTDLRNEEELSNACKEVLQNKRE